MCGRYTLTEDWAGLEKLVRFIFAPGARPEGPRHNHRVSKLVNNAKHDGPELLSQV